ncbi:MAG TPA: hypothetical protein VFY06_03840 [Verrucomicrobiae bacterium]|nr:hypothetical protein [Verrucomicrobiae bacterium]
MTIIRQIAQYGGHIQTTNAIPPLSGRWSIKSADDMSFQAHLSGVAFTNFASFMQQVYGESATTTGTVGHTWAVPGHIYYRAADIGAGIEFYHKWDGISLYCHRGIHVTPLATMPPNAALEPTPTAP